VDIHECYFAAIFTTFNTYSHSYFSTGTNLIAALLQASYLKLRRIFCYVWYTQFSIYGTPGRLCLILTFLLHSDAIYKLPSNTCNK